MVLKIVCSALPSVGLVFKLQFGVVYLEVEVNAQADSALRTFVPCPTVFHLGGRHETLLAVSLFWPVLPTLSWWKSWSSPWVVLR